MRTHRQSGIFLTEVLVYLAVLTIVLGVAYAAVYRCIDNSYALRRSADDISRTLSVGERWRTDIRNAANGIGVRRFGASEILTLTNREGATAYQFSTNGVARRVGDAPWATLLPNVKASTMVAEQRDGVTVWTWELELKPREKGYLKPGRVRPLFTFSAVPAPSK